MEKTGLVLEGGGMKGLFTAGVIDVFLENGIRALYELGRQDALERLDELKKWIEN